MTPTESQKPLTLSTQLFGGVFTKLLWLLLLAFLAFGLAGTFWDLSDADVLGSGQSLDAGSAAFMLIGSIVIAAAIALFTVLGKEQRAARFARPLSDGANKVLTFLAFLVGVVIVFLFLRTAFGA
jgi:hypothetical protein